MLFLFLSTKIWFSLCDNLGESFGETPGDKLGPNLGDILGDNLYIDEARSGNYNLSESGCSVYLLFSD